MEKLMEGRKIGEKVFTSDGEAVLILFYLTL